MLGYTIVAASGSYKLHKLTLPVVADEKFIVISEAPKAARIGVVRDFVVVGDIFDDVLNARVSTRVQWSGFNNVDLWTPSPATQSDVQDLLGRGGQIRRIVPGATGYVFQENGMVRMTYVGPPNIFRIDEIGLERGTPSGASVCWIDNKVYYYGHDDFYVFDGGSSQPLGANRIRSWVQAFAGRKNLNSLEGVVDRHNARVLWSLRHVTGAAPIDTHVLEYNYAADKWAISRLDHTLLLAFATTAITPDSPSHGMDDFDTASSPWYGTSLDSDIWAGGVTDIVGVTDDHRLGAFGVDPLTAVLTTRERMGPQGSQWLTTQARPLVSGNESMHIEVSLGYRDREDADVVFTPYKSLGRTGFAPFKIKARFQRARLRISGGFSQAQGVVLTGRPMAGMR